MKPKPSALLLASAAFVALTLAAACGGEDEAGVRTQRGLGVAALAVGGADQTGGQSGEAGLAPAPTPIPEADLGVSRGGFAAPDVFPFPSLQESQDGITVQGFGSASAAADSAVLELYFGGKGTGIEPLPEPGRGQSEPSSGGAEAPVSQQAQPVTKADLQPVVDAIVAQGVSRGDVEVTVQPSYGDPYYGGSATIRVTVRNVDATQAIVSAAREAASGLANVGFQGTNVSYTVSDCASLERPAMQAAVEDARERGQGFASVLGVGLGPVVGASHFSSFPFGSPCASSFGGPYPLSASGGYAEGQTQEVQLFVTVTITFAIQ